MIELVCNEEKSEKNSEKKSEINSDSQGQLTKGAGIRRPKNIKQIGDVCSDKIIYIEDYAFTYINSLAYSNQTEFQAGVLLGEKQMNGDEKCVFIKGVIKARLGLQAKEKGVYFDEAVWNGIYTDIDKYFPELSIVGWFAAIPEVTAERMLKLKKIHLDNFAGAMKTFYLIDTVEKEENFYLYENGELKKQKGYVCFYERNNEMQEYMLERRGKSTNEEGPDKVMRNIRNLIKEKEELREQRKSARFMYVVSAFMVVVILVISINLMNNYQKMRKFDESISNLILQMSDDDSDDTDVVPVNKLEGGVYPTTEVSTEGLTEAVTEGTTQTSIEAVTEAPTQVSTEMVTEASYSTLYTVKSGDTIMGICKRYYGDASRYADVVAFNKLENADVLYVGQQIKLP